MHIPRMRLSRALTAFLLISATLTPLGSGPAVAATATESPAGEIVVVTVNALQRDVDKDRMQQLADGLTTRVGQTEKAPGAIVLPDVIVIQEITQTGLNLLRDKLNAATGAAYGVVGLSSNSGLDSDVKVKLLLNTTAMEYTGRTTWLDVCDSARLYQLITARERATGKEVAVAGVHLAPTSNDAGTVECRERNATEIRKQLAPYDDRGSVIGDFNHRSVVEQFECDPEETSAPMTWYSTMTAYLNGHAYLDAVRAYRRGEGLTMSDQWTFEKEAASELCTGGFGIRRMRLDYVFASDVLTPLAAGADQGWGGGGAAPGTAGCEPQPACKYSDHRFVWAQLQLPVTATPPPSTTEPPTVTSTSHIGDLDGSSAAAGKSGWRATVNITAHSDGGETGDAPLGGAVVSYSWSTSSTASSCTTGPDGSCTVTSDLLPKRQSSVSLSVAGISAEAPYDPTKNHDPDGSSNGTTVVITK